jgi:MoxR-like ATPase
MGHFLENLKKPDKAFTLQEAREAIKILQQQVIEINHTIGKVGPKIVGQENLVRRLIQAFIIGEHCLLEGYPGLVKTMLSKTLANMLGLNFKRVQFVPDMMPTDLTHRERLNMAGGQARIDWLPGPIFTNVLLADEINRASPKVQAALLEACEERCVTTLYQGTMILRPRRPEADPSILDEAELLGKYGPFFGEKEKFKPQKKKGQHFMVIATMNPIEQEGVFPLSEAQTDRFAYKLIVDYPPGSDLKDISEHAFENDENDWDFSQFREEDHVKTLYFLSRLRNLLLGKNAKERWFSEDNAVLREKAEFLINFTHARPHIKSREEDEGWQWTSVLETEENQKNLELKALLYHWQFASQSVPWISTDNKELQKYANNLYAKLKDSSYPYVLTGSSPRGILKIIRAAHVEAFMNNRVKDNAVYPIWEDFKNVALDVLRHRIRLSMGSISLGVKSDKVIEELLECF